MMNKKAAALFLSLIFCGINVYAKDIYLMQAESALVNFSATGNIALKDIEKFLEAFEKMEKNEKNMKDLRATLNGIVEAFELTSKFFKVVHFLFLGAAASTIYGMRDIVPILLNRIAGYKTEYVGYDKRRINDLYYSPAFFESSFLKLFGLLIFWLIFNYEDACFEFIKQKFISVKEFIEAKEKQLQTPEPQDVAEVTV